MMFDLRSHLLICAALRNGSRLVRDRQWPCLGVSQSVNQGLVYSDVHGHRKNNRRALFTSLRRRALLPTPAGAPSHHVQKDIHEHGHQAALRAEQKAVIRAYDQWGGPPLSPLFDELVDLEHHGVVNLRGLAGKPADQMLN